MTGFLLRRVGQSIAVLFIVSVIVFVLIHLLPGGIAHAILGPRATAAQIAAFNHENGFDKPLPVQYLIWLWHLLHGNLGYSYHLNQSVGSLIVERLPKTIVLNLLSLLVALVVAVPIGVRQAVRRNGAFDYAATGLAFVFYAMPVFFLGLLLVLWFSLDLRIFPAEAPQGSTIAGILSQPMALVLPVLTLALLTIALFSRYMRSAVMDNLVQDYVRTARAKGAGEHRVLYGHVLRNSLIPVATLLGLSLPALFAGALITESVFNYPGMGLLFWQEAQVNDYPTLLGITLIVGVATVVGNLLADIAYAVLDPRVRY
jgi:peptide/nickel transport system permease protein